MVLTNGLNLQQLHNGECSLFSVLSSEGLVVSASFFRESFSISMVVWVFSICKKRVIQMILTSPGSFHFLFIDSTLNLTTLFRARRVGVLIIPGSWLQLQPVHSESHLVARLRNTSKVWEASILDSKVPCTRDETITGSMVSLHCHCNVITED